MKIGFKNFKRFKDFPMIELAPITFLVGPNNSGKSSFIKGLCLLYDNLKFIESPSLTEPFLKNFSFSEINSKYGWGDLLSYVPLSDVNKVNNYITFIWALSDFNFELKTGASKEALNNNNSYYSKPLVTEFKIAKGSESILYELIDNKNDYKVSFIDLNKQHLLEFINGCIEWLDYKIQIREEKREGIFRKETLYEAEKYKDFNYLDYIRNVRISEKYEQRKQYLQKCLVILANYNLPNLIKLSSPEIENELKNIILDYIRIFLKKAFDLTRVAFISSFQYVEAHNASHDVILKIDDKNNFLSQTVNNYFTTVNPNDIFYENVTIHSWIAKWLKELHVASNFEILREGEGTAYRVKVVKENEAGIKYKEDLGKLGTGSIQIFILLLKIGISIKRWKETGQSCIINIEEPEQNLHPALQSKLAELLYQIFKKSDGAIRFIIETHSEYIIRNTQVIVYDLVKTKNILNEEKLNVTNPFKVYYFPSNRVPYILNYRIDGYFKNDFEPGFFDETENLVLKIL